MRYVVITITEDLEIYCCEGIRERLGEEIDIFLPMFLKSVRLRGRGSKAPRVLRQFPLFPGYAFIGWDGEFDWRRLYRCRFVSGILGSVGKPVFLTSKDLDPFRTDEVSERKKSSELKGSFQITLMKPGDHVRLLEGMFKGICGIYSGDGKVSVMLLGHEVTIPVKENALRKI